MSKMFQSSGLGRDVAMDLGTAWVRVAVKGKGLVLQEPAVAAVDRQTGQVLQVGHAAHEILGRTPGQLLAVRPLAKGVISDFTIAQAMIQSFLKQALSGRLVKPRLLIGVPSEISEVEERAVVEAGLQAGARRVYLMESPLAAALGAGIDAARPEGALVVDLGAGVTDAAVLSLEGVVAAACLPVGGDALDEALIQSVRQKHNLLLGLRTAEKIKETIGRVGPAEETQTMEIKGRCLDTGLPRNVTITSEETAEAFAPTVDKILAGVQRALEHTPPELATDVAKGGVLLTGGGSLLRGLDRLLAEATGIPVTVAEDPALCTVLGLEKTLSQLHRRQEGPMQFARRRQVGAG